MSKITYREALTVPIQLLIKMGLWPGNEMCTTLVLKLLFNLIVAITTEAIMLQNIANGIRTKNMKLLNWSICVFFPLTNLHVKTIPLWMNRKVFRSVLEDLDSRAFTEHPDKLNRHIQIIGRVANMIVRYFAIVMTIFLSIFSVLPSFTNVLLMMPAPFDTGRFDIAYRIAHLLVTSYLATMSATIDTFYMSLIALSGAELNILKERLMNILEEANESHGTLNKDDFDVTVWTILKECVILHDTITK